jgi:tetratricopeptide (TPR) repeat protein
MARRALVVGLSQYPNIGSLKQPPIDAERIVQILEKHGEYTVERLPQYWDEERENWRIDPNKPVTDENLADALRKLLIESCEDGQNIDALIYFAGHGLTFTNNMGRQRGALAFSNTKITEKQGEQIKGCESVILFDDLNALIQASQVQNLVLILDCCHSGFFIERAMTENSFSVFGNSSAQQKHRNYYCICACQSREESSMLHGDDHSIFSQAVINGLDKVNANRQGKVTTESLYDHIQSELSTKGPKFGQTAIKMGWGEGINIVSYPVDSLTTQRHTPSHTPNNKPHNLDPLLAHKFVGRTKDLTEIHDLLHQKNKTVIITAVGGMSGMGKSELARQYAYEYLDQYTGGICWLAANLGQESILNDLSQFMESFLEVTLSENNKNGNNKQIAQYFWQRWQIPGNILLIFDDVKNYADIQEFLPNDQRFHVLLTSQIDFQANRHVSTHPLKILERERSIELLEAFIGKERREKETNIADQLCAFLGDLPLGLDAAGRYLVAYSQLPLVAYWQSLQAVKINHASLNTNSDVTLSAEKTRGVIAAFQVTWERIGEIEPRSQALAAYFSLFALAPIPFSIDYENFDESTEELAKALKTLLDWHIITPVSDGENLYKLHNLMREFLWNKLTELENAEELKSQFIAEMIRVAQQIEEPVTNKIIKKVAPYIEHIIEVANNYLADLKTNFIDDLITPYNRLGLFYVGQGIYLIAQEWREKCLIVAEENLPADHSDIATSYNNLANLYRSQGKYEEAESLFLKAIAIDEKTLSADHPDLANHYNNLAGLYKSQGKYEEAESLFLKAIAIGEKTLSADHPDLATWYNNLAGLYESQGKYEEAESLYLKAIAIGEKTLSADHPKLAIRYNNLAGLYESQGKYEEAESLYLKAIAIGEKTLSADHPQLANHYANLAGLYSSQGKYEKAESLYRKAIAIDEKTLSADHPNLATDYNNLANLYNSQGKYEEAESLYLKAIAIGEKTLSADHPDLATRYNNLAGLYYRQGKYEEAEPLFMKTFEIFTNKLGTKHPDSKKVKNNLIYFWQQAIAEGRAGELKLLHEHPLGQSVLENS